jgi:glutathionylspermidine synthase
MMVKLAKTKPLEKRYLESLGFAWHTDSDNSSYIANELVIVNEDEALAYESAANELYDMFVVASEHIIKNNLFHDMGIPFNLIEMIKDSWENDIHWHLYCRFDFAGGVSGLPIKLLEFNADTPTSLFESSIIQWAILKANNLEESSQFNGIYEAISDNFQRLVTLEESVESFDEKYQGWKFLFSSIRGNIEEENTVRLLQHMATSVGFVTEFAFVDEIEFSDDGIFFDGEQYELWFKLIPWESIALEESDLSS